MTHGGEMANGLTAQTILAAFYALRTIVTNEEPSEAEDTAHTGEHYKHRRSKWWNLKHI